MYKKIKLIYKLSTGDPTQNERYTQTNGKGIEKISCAKPKGVCLRVGGRDGWGGGHGGVKMETTVLEQQ